MLNSRFIKSMIGKIVDNPPKLILPEQEDIRVREAQEVLIKMGFNMADINAFDDFNKYKDHIKNKKFATNWTDQMLEEYIRLPLVKSLLLLDMGYVDCLVAGANTATADVIKSSIRIVGLNDDTQWISSSFFLVNPENQKGYTYADCGVIPEPDSEQLASIAYQASRIHKLISDEEPKVAFLFRDSTDHLTLIFLRKFVYILLYIEMPNS